MISSQCCYKSSKNSLRKTPKSNQPFHLLLNKNLNLKNKLRVLLWKNQRYLSLWETVVVYFNQQTGASLPLADQNYLFKCSKIFYCRKQRKTCKNINKICKNRKRGLLAFKYNIQSHFSKQVNHLNSKSICVFLCDVESL